MYLTKQVYQYYYKSILIKSHSLWFSVYTNLFSKLGSLIINFFSKLGSLIHSCSTRQSCFYHRSWLHPCCTWAVFPAESWPCWRSSQWVLSPGYYHRMVSASQNAPGEPSKTKVKVDKKHQTETKPNKKLKQNVKHYQWLSSLCIEIIKSNFCFIYINIYSMESNIFYLKLYWKN